MNDVATFPPASGPRISWTDVPTEVRTAIEQHLGSRVADARSQVGGFSPGLAARLTLESGDRAFVKAVSPAQNEHTPVAMRAEGAFTSTLPADLPVPTLRAQLEVDDWVALVFDDVDGRQPLLPWRADELAVVLDAIDDLGRRLTPAPVEAPPIEQWLATTFRGFRSLYEAEVTGLDDLEDVDPWIVGELAELSALEAQWAVGIGGDTLLHADLRADNILLTDSGVVFVDWAHATIGAAWFDVLAMLPSVSMQGGPDPWDVFDAHPAARGADSSAVDAVVCALAGYFVNACRKPSPPGLPTVRAFQRAQGVAAVRWLKHRLGEVV